MFATAEKEVRAALDAYPDDPAGLSDDLAGDGFAQLQRISEVVEAKRMRWLADQDRRASYRRDGYLSSAEWLADRFGLARGTAKQEVKVAQALETMPEVRVSFAGGAVTSSAVRVLAEAKENQPEAFATDEPALVAAAVGRPIEELRRIVGDWSQALDEQKAGELAEALRERRRLNVGPTATRMVGVDGALDPEGGEALLTALQAIVDADLRSGSGADLRTPAQRRADALCELARRYLDSTDRPSVAGERPHVTVTVDMETLRGDAEIGTRSKRCALDHVGAVSAETARRLACDASILPVVMGGPSQPLDVGRKTSVIPDGLRRAVVLRDGGCRFPTCTRPHAWCDAHHVVHWADGGRTALINLLLMCRPHHTLVHEGGFGLKMVNDKPVFRRPDGSVIDDGRAPP